MWKPDESLDDFEVKAVPEAAEPPGLLPLRFTGRVEVLKPLASWEGHKKPDPAPVTTLSHQDHYRLSWFHRSLALGGTLAMIAIILTSAIVIEISDQAAADTAGNLANTAGDPSDLAMDQELVYTPVPTAEPFISDSISLPGSLFGELGALRSTVRRRYARPRVHVASYRPRRYQRRHRPAPPKFIPTTLIIYPENGEIRTRIEPWLTAVYTKPHILTN